MPHPHAAQLLANIRQGFSGLRIDQAKKDSALVALERWVTGDAYSAYWPAIGELASRGSWDILLYNFFQTMPFGTGGRRGPVGVGPNCFNPYTLSTSVQGHVEYMRKQFGSDSPLSVVVAFDVREFRDNKQRYVGMEHPLAGMRSRDFARIAAEVYAANGVVVHMPDPEGKWVFSTPELSFFIRRLGAKGGLNVSASHNHPDDNGGKFYDHRGGQEVPPNDEIFSTLVEAVQHAPVLPFATAQAQGLVRLLDPAEHRHYVALNAALSLRPEARGARVVFTNLHGAGDTNVGDALVAAGFDVTYVENQRVHDGQFTNVPFGIANPEVPESMGQAAALAKSLGADLVLATDPDADRIGLMARGLDGEMQFLNGNEIGALVTEHRFSRRQQDGTLPAQPIFVTTEVTSRLPVAIALSYGATVISDLLVGCKYIANVLSNLEENGSFRHIRGALGDYVLGLEESHGVLVSPDIRDKDAAGAAVVLAERASEEKTRGRTLVNVLIDAQKRVGVHVTRQVSIVIEGAVGMEQIAKIQAGFRALVEGDSLGGRKILRKDDFLDETGHGAISSGTDRAARNFVSFSLEGNVRCLCRPSGTEPKLKLYTEAVGEPLGEQASDAALLAAKAALEAILTDTTDQIAQHAYAFLGLSMPRFGLRLSPLLPLASRQDFVDKAVGELRQQADALDGAALRDWADQRLASYGKDGRSLVRHAVSAWLAEAQLSEAAAARVRAAFDLA
jgi:phosphoglucomutase/phosphomannomutase